MVKVLPSLTLKNSDMCLTQTSSLVNFYVSHECPSEGIHSRGALSTQDDLTDHPSPRPLQCLCIVPVNGVAMVPGMELHRPLSTRQIQRVHPLQLQRPVQPLGKLISSDPDTYPEFWFVFPLCRALTSITTSCSQSVLFIIIGFPIRTSGIRDTLKSERSMTKRTMQDLLVLPYITYPEAATLREH